MLPLPQIHALHLFVGANIVRRAVDEVHHTQPNGAHGDAWRFVRAELIGSATDQVVEHATEMKEQIMARNMPPWHADPLYGKFRNDISLTAGEMSELVDWLNAGLPRGTGPDPLVNLPAPPISNRWSGSTVA